MGIHPLEAGAGLTIRAIISFRRGLDPLLLPASVLGAVRTPTRFLWGANDPFGGPAVARRVVAAIPSAELEIIPGAGHAPWLDDLERCAVATTEFLEADPAASIARRAPAAPA